MARGRLALGAVLGAAFLACAGEVALSVAPGTRDAAADANAEVAPGSALREEAGTMDARASQGLVGEVDPTFHAQTVPCGFRTIYGDLAVAADDSIRVAVFATQTDFTRCCLQTVSSTGELGAVTENCGESILALPGGRTVLATESGGSTTVEFGGGARGSLRVSEGRAHRFGGRDSSSSLRALSSTSGLTSCGSRGPPRAVRCRIKRSRPAPSSHRAGASSRTA